MAKVQIPNLVPTLKISRRILDNKKQKAVGVIAAFLENDKVIIGWSRCRKGDNYSKPTAYTIAHGRAIAIQNDEQVSVPGSMYNDFVLFLGRCVVYFKDKEFPAWLNKEELAAAFTVVDTQRKLAEGKPIDI